MMRVPTSLDKSHSPLLLETLMGLSFKNAPFPYYKEGSFNTTAVILSFKVQSFKPLMA